MPLLIGIDVGTSGVRGLAVHENGAVAASASSPLPASTAPQPGWAEQRAEDWWQGVREVLHELALHLPDGVPVAGMAVASTSGTLLPVSHDGAALSPAIMYNDNRAAEESAFLNDAGAELTDSLGYRFNSSFALSKILWLKRNQPRLYERAHVFAHAADYLVSRLTGVVGVTDTSNVLKTGYDLLNNRWPGFLETVGLDAGRMPRVVQCGTAIGTLTETAAAETGLPKGIRVFAGASDGTAGFLASGAVEDGEFNSTLGTTLVLKGVADGIVRDPLGRIYCHAHPSGKWLPGAASNVGGEWIQKRFNVNELDALDQMAVQLIPTSLIAYPLERTGERFPFIHPDAKGFLIGTPRMQADVFAACMEGVAFVERWAYEILADLGCPAGERIYGTGGGSRSDVWMQLRADILGKSFIRPRESEPAFGMAVLAASAALDEGDLAAATRRMVCSERVFEPETTLRERWSEKYGEFRAACRERGYE